MNKINQAIQKFKPNQDSENVPVLRFPEFEGGWETNRIEDVAKVSSGGTPNRSKPDYWNGDIPWITTSLIDFNEIIEAEEFITIEGLNNSSAKMFPKGTILMAMYGQGKTRGKVSVLGIEASTNQACAALQLRNSLTTDFAFNYLAKDYHKIRNIANDGGQQNLSSGLIRSLKISYPSKDEQQKIASFLTAVDERIQLLQKKKYHLEEYKKGVMQKLFPAKEGQSPEIHFKDENGNDFPDWEEKRLGGICEKKSSNISANSLEEREGDYKIYGATGFLQFIDFYREEEPYISIIKDGAGVGRILLCDAKSSVLGTLDILKPKGKNNLQFMYSLISNIRFEKYITGSTIPHIYFRDYSKEKVKIPCPEEQKKIANFLSSMEKSIDTIETEIEGSIIFKKGLLQKMFV